jgi:predicted ATPase
MRREVRMIVAISGTHGSGKTTLVSAVSRSRPSWKVYPELSRSLVAELGYKSPYEIVNENGIAMLEACLLSHWSLLFDRSDDAACRRSDVELFDRSPIDNLAYYYVHRDATETRHERLLIELASRYLSYVDLHIYVPRLPFGVQMDAIQREETQNEVENAILDLYGRFNVEYCLLSGVSIEDRSSEVLDVVAKTFGRHV